ncbi:hypothetical protein D3C86_1964270 [compost metagenome]
MLEPPAAGAPSVTESTGIERQIAKIMTATVTGTEVLMSVGMIPSSGLWAMTALLILAVLIKKFAVPLGYSKSPRSASAGS